MKKTLTRMLALLMVLSCALTMFGCAEEEESSSRRRKSRKETTEEYSAFDENAEAEGTEEALPENTPTVPGPHQDAPPVEYAPGSYGMPAIELMELTYDELSQLRWDYTETEDGERWLFRADCCSCSFMFVFDGEFQDPSAKPAVMNIEDTYDNGYAYLTQDIQICHAAYQLPDEIAEKIEPMDGGLSASFILNGYEVDILFDGDMEHADEATMHLIQVRQED